MTGRGAAQGCARVCVTGWFLKMQVGEGKEGGGAWGLKRTACSDTLVLKPVNTACGRLFLHGLTVGVVSLFKSLRRNLRANYAEATRGGENGRDARHTHASA